MGFQKEIKAKMGVSNPGEIIEAVDSHKLVMTMTTEDDQCQVGKFVRVGSKDSQCVFAGNSTYSSNKLIGIIARDRYYTGEDEGVTLKAGSTVTVVLEGVVAVASSEAGTLGASVYITSAGEITYTATDNTATDWVVHEGCSAGEIAYIRK